MHAAPAAEPSDGAYDVVVVRGTSRLAMLSLLLTFDAGGHVEHPARHLGAQPHVDPAKDAALADAVVVALVAIEHGPVGGVVGEPAADVKLVLSKDSRERSWR